MQLFVYFIIFIIASQIVLEAALSKVYAKKADGNPNAIWVCLTITATFACAFFALTGIGSLTVDAPLIIYSIIYGTLIEIAYFINIFALKISNITLVLIFSSVGSIVFPAIVGFSLGEEVAPAIIIGLILLLTATVIPCISSEKSKTKIGFLSILVNLLNLIFQGFAASFSKFIAINPHIAENTPSLFLLTNALMLIVSATLLAFFACRMAKRRKKQAHSGDSSSEKAPYIPILKGYSVFLVVIILMMTLLSNTASYLEIFTLKYIGISALSLVRSSLTLLLSYIPSIFFFKEKPTKKEIVSTIICIAGLCVYFI